MYPNSFKEELGSGLCCDALLADGQNRHLRKVINTTKTQSFSLLVDGRPDMQSMEMDSHGLSGAGRGVYKPCFLVVGLAIAQAMQDLIYLLTSCRSFGK
jgi:hypothetical protein